MSNCTSKASSFALMVELILVAVCVGCMPVIDQPVGEFLPPSQVNTICGVWLSDSGELMSVVSRDGTLFVAHQTFNAKSLRFEVQTCIANPRKLGDTIVVFLQSSDSNNYSFVSIALNIDGTEMELRMPSANGFAGAVKAGKLKGSVDFPATISVNDGPVVRLDITENEFRSVLENGSAETFFPVDSRVNFKKIQGARIKSE